MPGYEGMRVLEPGYEGTRVLEPGYEDINSISYLSSPLEVSGVAYDRALRILYIRAGVRGY